MPRSGSNDIHRASELSGEERIRRLPRDRHPQGGRAIWRAAGRAACWAGSAGGAAIS